MDVFAGDCRTYIVGEHGDSSLATLSHATIGGMSLGRIIDLMGIRQAMLAEAEDEARKIGTEIFLGVVLSTPDTLSIIFRWRRVVN